MLVLLGIGFLAGLATAISPCVLPVLPILLAGGASGRKPFRIIAGLVASFVVFTLFATWLLNHLGLPDDLLRNVAIAMLFLVAATLLVPRLGLLIEKPFARLTRFRAGGGGFLLGASLGLVFVPCAGPVLATISVVAANEQRRAAGDPADARLRARSRAADAADRARRAADRQAPAHARRRVCAWRPGVVIGLVAIAIALNLDTRFQTALPGYTAALQKHTEETAAAQRALDKIRGGKRSILDQATTTTTTPIASAGPGRLEPAGDRPEGPADRRRRRLVQHQAADARRRSAGRSCCSTSGRTRASTACARSRTWRPGTRRTTRTGS